MSLPESTKTNPVDCIKDLLANAPDELGGYGNAYSYSYSESQAVWPEKDGEIVAPEVYLMGDVSQQERENANGARLYVWSPTEPDSSPFDAEVSAYNDIHQVEIHIWTPVRIPGEQVHVDMGRSVFDFLALYSNDNERRTPFHRIRPLTPPNDLRHERQPRQGSHFVDTLTVEMRRLTDVVVA